MRVSLAPWPPLFSDVGYKLCALPITQSNDDLFQLRPLNEGGPPTHDNMILAGTRTSSPRSDAQRESLCTAFELAPEAYMKGL